MFSLLIIAYINRKSSDVIEILNSSRTQKTDKEDRQFKVTIFANEFNSPNMDRIQSYIYIYIYIYKCVECLLVVQETWVQPQVASYQRLLKCYLIPPCLTLSNIRYVSRVKWSNPWKELAPSHRTRCSSYWKGSLLVTLDNGCQLYLLLFIYIYIYIYIQGKE